jgi:hypothetical protein
MQTRTRLVLVFLVTFLLLGYAATRLASFIHIFFTHAGIALTQAQIKEEFTHYAVTGAVDPRPQSIPRKIHQVYHDWHRGEGGNKDVTGGDSEMDWGNTTIPSDWDEVRATCWEKNPGWEYTVCTSCPDTAPALMLHRDIIPGFAGCFFCDTEEICVGLTRRAVVDRADVPRVHRDVLSLVFEHI